MIRAPKEIQTRSQDHAPAGLVHEKVSLKNPPNEAEKYAALKRIFRESDAALTAITEEMLPQNMLKLKGIQQTGVHGGLDPLQHTLRMLAELDTRGLKYPELMRAAAFYHDVGKASGALSEKDIREHPSRSAEIAEPILRAMGYDGWEKDVIVKLVRTHNLLGLRSQFDEDGERRLATYPDVMDGITPPKSAADYVTRQEMLEMNYRLTLADVKSIPGLQDTTLLIKQAFDEFDGKV